MNNMARHLELFNRDFAIPGEEQNIPIFEPHCSYGFGNTQPADQKKYRKKPIECKEDAPKSRLEESKYGLCYSKVRLGERGIRFANTIMPGDRRVSSGRATLSVHSQVLFPPQQSDWLKIRQLHRPNYELLAFGLANPPENSLLRCFLRCSGC